MSVTLKPKYTATAGKVPTTTDLVDGEFGVNITDGGIYKRVGATIYAIASYLTLAQVKSYYDAVVSVLTNKDLTSTTNTFATVTTVSSSATPSPTGGSRQNELYVTALAVGATFAAPSGSPVNGNRLIIRVKDDGTARALAYNAIYRAVGVTLPTTTVAGKTLYLGMAYNSADSRWDCIAAAQEV